MSENQSLENLPPANEVASLAQIQSALERIQSTTNLPADVQPLIAEAQAGLDAARQEYAASLVYAANDKALFVSTVTHELRVPLTSIKGYADMLYKGMLGPVSDPQKNFLEVIRKNAERMANLIANLSIISYLDSGRMKFSLKPSSAATSIEEAITSLKNRIEEKQANLLVDADPALPLAMADSLRLVEILANLIQNAVLYSPKGSNIRVSVQQEGTHLRFQVQDNGAGMNAEDQAKVFEQFFRSDDEIVRENPGWGLSLHVSRRLIQAMGGAIGFESTLKQGSTFWFSIPLAA